MKDCEIINEILKEGETEYAEFKKAEKGFPVDALKTISAFANTRGGYLYLGISETCEFQYEVTGVNIPQKVIDGMFTLLNNQSKISRNPISESDVKVLKYGETQPLNVIVVTVPQVSYKEKPVYLNSNPNQSYYRQGTSDFQCTREMVQLMERDASSEPFDSKYLEGYSVNDFDFETVHNYRIAFSKLNPEHPFCRLEDNDFLFKIHALAIDRNSKSTVPTVAGLLVFGKHTAIKDFLPHYNVEYIKKSQKDKNIGYSDRVIYDGAWGEDNLYNFFSMVIEKLYLSLSDSSDMLDDQITRASTSKLRLAIREALVNSIIHCDFMDRKGIEILRYPDRFIFSNGGTLRISEKDFYSGGHSDPRNYYIQEIFRLVGLCEKAGTGIPKIMDAVKTYSLLYPKLIIDMSSFEFTIWDVSITSQAKNEIESKILELIVANKMVTINEVSKALRIHRNTASKYLSMLIERGILERNMFMGSYQYMIFQSDDFKKYNIVNSLYSMVEEVNRRA